ncbi:MAG: hypothetical protein WC538_14990 [Thermoanaerobaculia bacterium]|jgi:ElaB/YqjD/DUF883 family membrane-anchored ribosome-binding protein
MNKNIEAAMGNIDSKIDRTREAVDAITSRAEQGVLKAADDVAQQTHDAGTYLHESVQAATQDAHQRLNDSALAIDRGYNRARSEMSRAAASARSFATENPGTALMIAASAGFAVGMLAHRHRPWA